MLAADDRGASFDYKFINYTIQYKEADFVWPPCRNMTDLKMQTLSYEYKWLNILLEAGDMDGV